MKSALYNRYKTNKDAEVEGVRHIVGINEDKSEIAFTLARMGGANKAYSEAFKRLSEPYRAQIQANALAPELAEKLMREAFFEGCVKGVENVPDENGEYINFDKQSVCKVFEDLPDLFDELSAKAKGIDSYREAILEADAKN